MTILWDWNGTLLQDAEPVAAMTDRVFRENGYRGTSLEEYRELFRFPVREYYRTMGIPERDFDRMAHLWTDAYNAMLHEPPLRPDTLSALRRFRQAGCRQAIVSASEQTALDRQVSFHPEVRPLLDAVVGLKDIYAVSKVESARQYLEETGSQPGDTWFIGDTTHDAQVAQALGLHCILVQGGHQSRAIMAGAGVPLAESLTDAAEMILGR